MKSLETRENTAIMQLNNPMDLLYKFSLYVDAKPRTVESYIGNIKRFLEYLKENNISKPNREDIIAYRDYLKANYKATTTQSYIIAIRQFFKWLEQEGIYSNVADNIKGARISKEHKKDALTSNQVTGVLKGIDRSTEQGKRDYAMLALMVTGGLRDIEVTRANIGDIRPLADQIVLYIQGKGKDDKEDYIKLVDEVQEAIKDYLKTRDDIDEGAPLFTSLSNNSKGRRLTTRSVSGTVKKHLKKSGLNSSRLTAHSLRHTAVTLTLLNGGTLQEAQEFARHTSITTTQIYAHNLNRLNNKSEDRIANSIF